MKTKTCPLCNRPGPTDNKGRIKRHTRWDWPNWPDPKYARSSNMTEVECK